MPGRSLVRRAIVGAAIVCANAGLAAAQRPTSLTFFGDSFTDTGNGDLIALGLGFPDPTPTPPYFPGRISNGPVWADYLAAAFGHPFDALPSLAGGRNFAVGTARTGLTGTLGLPIGMTSQLAAYAASGQAPDPTGLYTLFGGSLDVFDAALLATPAQQAVALGTAANNVAFIASQLYAVGARSFLVPSIANVGLTPRGRSLGEPASALLGALTMQYNGLLASRIATLQSTLPGSTFYGLRLDNLFANVLADAATGGARYGLPNATVPCFLGPPCSLSVFADDLHPTTAAHALIAQAAFNRIVHGQNVALAPEPSTLVLAAGGAALVAGVARRRRAA